MRGSAADYEAWADLGNPEWGFADLLPYFRKTEADPLGGPFAGSDGPVPIYRVAEAELAPCLTPMVARLNEPYRQAIELTSVHGLTQAQAAKRAGVSVSGMKSRVQRAREQLKAMLLRCCEVDVDRRRGVADFHMRESASCGNSSDTSASSSGCGVGACSPRR